MDAVIGCLVNVPLQSSCTWLVVSPGDLAALSHLTENRQVEARQSLIF